MKYPEHDPALPVVAFDFDGVLAANLWPSPQIGDSDPAAFEAIKHYHELGCEIVVFTARPDSHFERIWAWLRRHDIAFAIYNVTNRKPTASLYFDDRAVRWPIVRRRKRA